MNSTSSKHSSAFISNPNKRLKRMSFGTASKGSMLAIGALFVTSISAQATNGSWANTTSGDWNTNANWTPNTSNPGATGTFTNVQDVATFVNVGTVAHTVTDSLTNRSIGTIQFTGAGTGSNYTVGSAATTLYFNTSGTITQGGTNNSTINSNIMIGGNGGGTDIRVSAAATGTLTIGGTVSSAAASGTSRFAITSGNAANTVLLAGNFVDGANAIVAVTHGSGAGIVDITGTNTYSGGFVSGGGGNTANVTLIGVDSVGSVGSITSSAFGRGTLSLNGGTISSDGTTARTIYNTVDIRSATNVFGNATNNGVLTFAGAVTMSAGSTATLQADSTVNFTNSAITTGTSQGETFSGTANGSIAAVLGSNVTTITKIGTNTWTFSGANGANTGAAVVNDGTLRVGANNIFGLAVGNTMLINETTVGNTATLDLNGFNLQVSGLNFGGATAAAGSTDRVINSTGTSTLTLAGNILYSATNSPSALISVTNLNLGAGTRTITTQDGSFAADLTISSNIQGTAGFSKAGTGVLLLTGTSTNSGATKVNDGTLQLGVNNALLTTGTLIVNEAVAGNTGTFDLNGFSQQLALIQLGDAASATTTSTDRVINSIGTSTLTTNAVTYNSAGNPLGGLISVTKLDLNGTPSAAFVVGDSTSAPIDLTVSSVIQNGGIAKSGLGSLYLNGANTYAGATALSGGTLIVGGSSTVTAGTLVNGPLGTGTFSNTNNTVLDDDGTNVTLANSVQLAGTLTLGSTGSGSLTFDGTGLSVPATFVLTQNAGLTVTNTSTIKNVISGGFNFTKNGTGTLVLTGANIYTGSTTITNGVLSINSIANVSGGPSALGAPITAATGTISLAGTLQYTGSSNGSSNRAILLTGAGGGAGTLDASGSAAFALSGGVASAGTTGVSTLTLTGLVGDSGSQSGVIANGTGSNLTAVTKTGAGTWILSGANTYTGTTTITNGVLQLGSGSTTGKLAAASAIVDNANFTINRSNAVVQGIDFSTAGITGSGGLTQAGTGTTTLNAANLYTGLTLVTGGELDLNNAGGVTVNGNLTVGNGTAAPDADVAKLLANNQIVTTGTVTVNSDGKLDLNNRTNTVAALISVGGDIASTTAGGNLTSTAGPAFSSTGNKIGTGVTVTSSTQATLASSGDIAINGTLADSLAMGSSSSLSGTGTITNAITLAGSNTLSSAGMLTTGGLTVNNTGNSISGGSVTGAITQNASSALTVNGAGGSDALANLATLNGTGSVGAVTLAGNNTLSSSSTLTTSSISVSGAGNTISSGTVGGNVTINSAGVLTVAGTASGTVGVSNGGALKGTGTVGATTVSGGGSIALQNGTVGTLTVGGLSIGNAGTPSSLTFDIGTTLGSVDLINDTGALTLNGANGTNISITALGSVASGTYTLISYSGALTGGLSNLNLTTTTLDGKTATLGQSAGVIYLTVAPSVSGTTYTLSTTAGTSVLHAGGSTSLTTTITNTGTLTADTLNYTGLGATGTTVSGSTTNGGPLAQGATGTNTLQTFSDTTAGAHTITPVVGSATNATAGGPATPTGTTTASVFVYSGQGVWNTNGGGSWGTVSAAPVNWTANGGTPGLDTGFTNTDSASFGSVLTSGTGTVTLDGDSPSLNAITFNNSSASYLIAQGGGTGSITLKGNGGNATITDTAGNHEISAPVNLATSADVNVASGQQLTVSGTVSGSGGLNHIGSGTTILTGSNNYSGGTSVTAGTLRLSNTSGSATGSGALSVGAGATLAGSGTSNGTGFTISGDSTTRATVLVGHDTTADTNTTGALTLTGSGASSIDSANLVFNLDSTTANAGNKLNVGNTAITFNSVGSLHPELSLNLVGDGNPAFNTYVLISGTGVTTIALDGTTSGQYSGLTTFLNAQGQHQIVTTGVGALTLAFVDPIQGASYAPSYLFLNTAGGVDEIDVEVVPEPGTWAMMLGGLAMLIVWQRRKKNS